ncbi:MAG TPA: hypothetical protein VEA37_04015, partial [Flavobacterium sp.]|nr:hypothetical protein [Flavobacterium sp.]
MITFYLDFVSSGHGKRDIDEPTSFDGAEFIIEQEENRLGRDVSGVTGGTSRLRLNALPEHCFDIIQYNFDRFGFEADVKLGVRISDTETIIGQIDFNTFQTDGKSYVEFVVTEVGERALIKRRYDATTNLFSYTTIDDEETDPVQTSTVWRPAKPIINISEWETPAGGGQSASVSGLGGEGSNVFKFFNFSNVVKRYDIGNTLGYLQGDGEANDFGYLEAKENLQDIVVTISNLTYTLAGTGNGEGRFRLKYFIGTDDELTDGYGQGDIIKFHNMVDDGNYGETEATYTIEIPFIERGKKLYIYFATLTQSATNLDTYGFVTTIETMNVGITATEVGYSTIIQMARLIDAMKYVVQSAAALPVSAPRWELGGEFY